MPKVANPLCRICDNNQSEVVYAGVAGYLIDRRFDLRRCLGCNTIYTFPFLTAEETKAYYDRQATAFNGEGGEELIDAYLADRERYWRELGLHDREAVIRRHHPKAHLTLDVGCGAGLYVDYLAHQGYEAEGLELSDWGYQAAVKVGAAVKQCRINEVQKPGSYDVITMYDVLEHTHFPRADLEAAARMLADEGILVVNLPNIDSLVSRLTAERWNKLIPPNHTFHFTPATLAQLIRGVGFEVLWKGTNNGDPGEFGRETLSSIWRGPSRVSRRVRKAYQAKDLPYQHNASLSLAAIKATQKAGEKLAPAVRLGLFPIVSRLGVGEGVQIVARKPRVAQLG